MPQRTFAKPVEVQITGSILTYDIDDPLGGKGEPVKTLAAQFPDLRRFIREGYVRYAFTRFGVPYVVSIQCLDSVPRAKRLACREAYPVAERFLRRCVLPAAALAAAHGYSRRCRGTAGRGLRRFHLPAARRHHPGQRLSQTGRARRLHRLLADPFSAGESAGLCQLAIVSRAQVESQIAGPGDRTESYPWRDNFCEARNFGVGQCAGGFGHQGQDIRPACSPRNEGAERCDPRQQASSPFAKAC